MQEESFNKGILNGEIADRPDAPSGMTMSRSVY